eukprot:3085366-Pyramimonas_sp.AAC.1
MLRHQARPPVESARNSVCWSAKLFVLLEFSEENHITCKKYRRQNTNSCANLARVADQTYRCNKRYAYVS